MTSTVETGSRFLDRCVSLAPAPLLAPLAAVGRGVSSVPMPSALRQGGQADEFACRQLDRIEGIAKGLRAYYAPSQTNTTDDTTEGDETNNNNNNNNNNNVPKDGSRAMRILSRLTQRIPDLSAVGSRALVRAGDLGGAVTHVVVGGATFVRTTIGAGHARLHTSVAAGRDAVSHAVEGGVSYVRTTVDRSAARIGTSVTAGKDAVTHVVVDGVTYVRARAAASRLGGIVVDGTAFVRARGEGIRDAVRDRTDAVTHVVAGGVVFVRDTLAAGAHLVTESTDNAKNIIVTKTTNAKQAVYTTTNDAKTLIVTKTNDAKTLIVTKTNDAKQAVSTRGNAVISDTISTADALGTRALRTTTRVASALCDACDTTVAQVTGNRNARIVRTTAESAGKFAIGTAGTVASMSPPAVRDAILATVGWICQDIDLGTTRESDTEAIVGGEADEATEYDGDDDDATLAEVHPSEGTTSPPSSPRSSSNRKAFTQALFSPGSDLDTSILDASAGELAIDAERDQE